MLSARTIVNYSGSSGRLRLTFLNELLKSRSILKNPLWREGRMGARRRKKRCFLGGIGKHSAEATIGVSTVALLRSVSKNQSGNPHPDQGRKEAVMIKAIKLSFSWPNERGFDNAPSLQRLYQRLPIIPHDAVSYPAISILSPLISPKKKGAIKLTK